MEHVLANHSEDKRPVVCPICATAPGFFLAIVRINIQQEAIHTKYLPILSCVIFKKSLFTSKGHLDLRHKPRLFATLPPSGIEFPSRRFSSLKPPFFGTPPVESYKKVYAYGDVPTKRE